MGGRGGVGGSGEGAWGGDGGLGGGCGGGDGGGVIGGADGEGDNRLLRNSGTAKTVAVRLPAVNRAIDKDRRQMKVFTSQGSTVPSATLDAINDERKVPVRHW